jgi:hypothetical protein
MAKALIIGLGFGQAVYKPVLTELGYEVITVDMDTSKGADFSNLDDAIRVHGKFDTVNICTPNFTHIKLARAVAPHANIVFVEKPGVVNSEAWRWLCADYPTTRFMMVKNNSLEILLNSSNFLLIKVIQLELFGIIKIVFQIQAVGSLPRNWPLAALVEI